MEFVNITWVRLISANIRASCPDIVRAVPATARLSKTPTPSRPLTQ